MKNSFFSALKKGLFALMPLIITLALIRWMYHFLESSFGSFAQSLFGSDIYFPGLGIIIAIVVLVFVGYVLDYLLIQKFTNFAEKILARIPLVKTLYLSLRQFMTFFKSDENKMGQAVKVRIGDQYMLGIMTRENLDTSTVFNKDEVAVFLPMSYQIGGYTVIIKRENVEVISMKVEELLKFSVTAGVLNEIKN